MRRITKIKRIGHTGTLDPNVEGVLPICLGEATKTIPYLQQLNKEYIAEITLGISTTTEDADGDIVEHQPITTLPSPEAIEETLNSFLGTIKQTPPMYSEIRVKGKRLYEYARENLEVERPERTVTINHIKQIENNLSLTDPSFRIVVNCSKGTYIRTLAAYIGKKLGYPAHMSYLKRIETDSFTLDETVTLEEIERKAEEGKLSTIIEPIERGLQHLPVWQVPANIKRRVLLGQKLKRPTEMKQSPFLVMHNNQLLAIYKHHSQNEKEIKPVRVFNMYKNEGE